eukprot:scaffold36099_cov60-Phaeocystis_antarctica.AAC.1
MQRGITNCMVSCVVCRASAARRVSWAVWALPCALCRVYPCVPPNGARREHAPGKKRAKGRARCVPPKLKRVHSR